jgi:hypothetical protein
MKENMRSLPVFARIGAKARETELGRSANRRESARNGNRAKRESAMCVNIGYVHRLAEHWRVNVHELF